MRAIERTSQFKRDYKRESRGRHRASLDASLVPVLEALAQDTPLEHRHHDHALSGEWADHRDCHGTVTGAAREGRLDKGLPKRWRCLPGRVRHRGSAGCGGPQFPVR